jgi:tetratricopeptide (TPR) repeat protein
MAPMTDVRKALEAEREMEREFVAQVTKSEVAPKGWPAALNLFHISMWRERLRNALVDVREGHTYTPSPQNQEIDEVNDAELASGLGVSLSDIAERSDTLLAELIALSDQVGERPFKWNVANTTSEALLRNSYTHPRVHFHQYWKENGDPERAHALYEDALSDMRDVSAPPTVMGAVLYNLACTRVAQERPDEALTLLEEALPLRPDLKQGAPTDSDLAPLYDNPRFQAAVKS